MSKTKNTKITLEDFISKATEKYNKRKMSIDIYIEELDGEVSFNRPSEDDLLSYMSDTARAVKANKNGEVIEQDLSLMLEASKKLSYDCCNYLHNTDLHKALEVIDPYDIVTKIFGIDGAIEIAGKIAEEFMDKDIHNKVKN